MRHGKGQLFDQYLAVLTSGTEEGERLKEQLLARGQEEIERRRHLLDPLSRVLMPFRDRQTRQRLLQDVLRPAQMRQVSSQEAWDRFDRILQNDKLVVLNRTSRAMEWAESVFGALTFTIGAGIEGGAGAGVEAAVGLAGLRHHRAAFVRASTVALGAYAELSGSIQASVGGGIPESSVGLTMDVSVNAAYGIAGEITVSLQPTPHPPTLAPEKPQSKLANALQGQRPGAVTTRPIEKRPVAPNLFGGTVYQGLIVDYAFAGLGVSIGVWAPGGGASAAYTVSETFVLGGTAK